MLRYLSAFTLQQRLTLAKETDIFYNAVSPVPISEADVSSDEGHSTERLPRLMSSSVASDSTISSRTSSDSGEQALGSDPTIMSLGRLRRSAEMPFDTLAREFGIEPDVVQALAQRLSLVSTSPAMETFTLN